MKLSRREMLGAILGAPFVESLVGCDEPAVEIEGGFIGPSMKLGHRLQGKPPSDTELANAPTRQTDVAIVGGGPAALAAGWRLMARGHKRFEVLELEPRTGGTALSDRSDVCAYPWGAHYITTPMANNTDLTALLDEMGMVERRRQDGTPVIAEQYLVKEPKERVHYRGHWYSGLYPAAGASVQEMAEFARFAQLMTHYAALKDGQGRRAFALPVAHGSDDAQIIALDRIPATRWLDAQDFHSKRLRWLLDYNCRDDYGASLEQTSAWALILYHASRMYEDGSSVEVITWPEGNGALVGHLDRRVGARAKTGKLVVDVTPNDSGVAVGMIDAASGQLEVVQAKRAIVAVPRFIASRITRPLRGGDAAKGFEYGAWLVANLHLAGRPKQRGVGPAWDNVIHDSPSLGYVAATHQRGRDQGPTVWTYYLPMTNARPADGRRRLLQPSWADQRDAVLADLGRAHSDLRAHVRRLDVCRWGHGMIQPGVNFVWSAARRNAATPIGAIHFAHSDLSGVALFEEALFHGLRAANEVADALDGGTPT